MNGDVIIIKTRGADARSKDLIRVAVKRANFYATEILRYFISRVVVGGEAKNKSEMKSSRNDLEYVVTIPMIPSTRSQVALSIKKKPMLPSTEWPAARYILSK